LQDRAEDFAALRGPRAADARSALQSLSQDLSACLADRSRADLPAPNQQSVPTVSS
jgi:hypothetical protein